MLQLNYQRKRIFNKLSIAFGDRDINIITSRFEIC